MTQQKYTKLDPNEENQRKQLSIQRFQHVYEILRLALPVLLANICNFGMNVTDTMFVGHLGSDEFAAAALATTWNGCIIFMGGCLTNGMDTLSSQAFGAGNFQLVGIIYQNVLFIMTIASIPIMGLVMLTEPVVLLMNQPSHIASAAGLFSKWSLIGILPYLYFRATHRWMQGQGIVLPSLVVGMFSFLLNILFNYLFIFQFNLGLRGSALATSISRLILPIALWGFIYIRKYHEKTWYGWSSEMFNLKRLKTYMRFALANGLMILFEFWGFEATTILVGLLTSKHELNAHTIGFNSLIVSFTVPLAISIGTSTRIGHKLGEGKPDEAKGAAKVGSILMLAFMMLNASLITIFRKQYGSLYTNDKDVIVIVSKLLPICAAVAFLDGVQVFLGGIMRGAGVGKKGTILNFIGYYIIAIPLYFIFGKVLKGGIYGIWGSLALGITLVCIGFIIIILRIDWDKQSKLAQERSEKQDNEEMESFVKNDDDKSSIDEFISNNLEEGNLSVVSENDQIK